MGKLFSLVVLLAFVANTTSPQTTEFITRNQTVKSNFAAVETKFNSLIAKVNEQVDEMGRKSKPANISLSIDKRLLGLLDTLISVNSETSVSRKSGNAKTTTSLLPKRAHILRNSNLNKPEN